MNYVYSFHQAVPAPKPTVDSDVAFFAMPNLASANAANLFAYRAGEPADGNGTNRLQSHATEGSA